MKTLQHTSLALLGMLIMGTQTPLKADVLSPTELHATLGIVTNFILDNNSIRHHGTSYNKVTSPYTGKVWLDRNLGASRVCVSVDDTQCYGDYYQWGRDADGHEDSLSNTTFVKSATVVNVGHGDFILPRVVLPIDWVVNGVDNFNTLRIAQWSKIDGTSVCPVGFRVPTFSELDTELLRAENKDDAYQNFLKFGAAGRRDALTGNNEFGVIGKEIFLWTITVGDFRPTVTCILFQEANKRVNQLAPNFGGSVRCIKD